MKLSRSSPGCTLNGYRSKGNRTTRNTENHARFTAEEPSTDWGLNIYQEKERPLGEDIDNFLGEEILSNEVFAPAMSCEFEQRVGRRECLLLQTRRVVIAFGNGCSLLICVTVGTDAFKSALGRKND